ncbi:HEAT repeat domain-containing protein [Methanoculleus taiwanensis]|uniref:HEAT repeat domain-containing protein n=1 Tax=Methanoculleus taiwanensis TaxID=1550565 RepID=UPI0013E8A598|nr:HEAT repeat domain-containing protein [Methanoculleus taiwanensis]
MLALVALLCTLAPPAGSPLFFDTVQVPSDIPLGAVAGLFGGKSRSLFQRLRRTGEPESVETQADPADDAAHPLRTLGEQTGLELPARPPAASGDDEPGDSSALLERIDAIPTIVERYSAFASLDDDAFRSRMSDSDLSFLEDDVLIGSVPELHYAEEEEVASGDTVPLPALDDPTCTLMEDALSGLDELDLPESEQELSDLTIDEPLEESEPDGGEPVRLSQEELLVNLRSDDPDERRHAVQALGATGAAAVEPLIGMLGDAGDQARWAAADALRLIGAPAIPPLIHSLKDPALQLGAATALVKIGEPAVPHLIDALTDGDRDILIGAVYALEEIGDAAIPYLVPALTRPEGGLSRKVAELLGELGWEPENAAGRIGYLIAREEWIDIAELGEPAVEPLIELLESPDPQTRRSAARTLGAMGEIAVDRLVAVFRDGGSERRKMAALALADIGTPAVGPLVGLLRNEETRTTAAMALTRIGEPAVQPLLSALQEESAEFLESTLAGIGEAAETALIQVLMTGGTDEGRVAVPVLERMGWEPWNEHERAHYLLAKEQWADLALLGQAALAPLIRALASTDPAIRREAADILGQLGDAEAVLPLVRALADEPIRIEAAEALAGIGTPAVAPLLQVLEQGDGEAKRLAAGILGRIGSAEVTEPLVQALYAGDDRLRRVVIDSLAAIGAPAVAPLIEMLGDADDLQMSGILALARIGAGSIDPLRLALSAKNPRIRAGAAETLERLGWSPGDDGDRARYLVARERWVDAAALGEPAVAPLIDAFCDLDGAARAGAGEALVRIGGDAAPSLIALLGDDASGAAAAALLERIGTPAIDPLIRLLGDEEAGRMAADILVRMGEPAGRALVPLLAAPDSPAEARRALIALGTDGVGSLIAALRDESLRREAADILLAIGSDAYAPLIRALSDPDEEIRLSVAAVLTRAGTAAAGDLVDALGADTFRTRLGAAEVLGRIGWRPESEAELIRYLLAKEQWTELARLGAPAVAPLILALGDPDGDIQMGAASALGMIGEPAVSPLILALRDEDAAESEKAIEALRKIGEPAVHALIQAFLDEDRQIRLGAARALVRIGAPAVDPLIQALHMGSHSITMGAAAALGKIGDPRAVDSLVLVLLQEDWHIGRLAVHALGMLGEPAIEPLKRVLKDGSETAWEGAVAAIVMIGAPAVPHLCAMLTDGHFRVRAGAAEALDRLHRTPDGPSARADYLIAKEQWVDLVHLGKAAVEPLIGVLGDGDDSVRRRAAGILGEMRDGRAAEPLVRLLADDFHSIRREAAAALVKIGAPSVAPLVRALANGDEDVRRRAAAALGDIGGVEAVEPLRQALGDASWHVQQAARDALFKIRQRRGTSR